MKLEHVQYVKKFINECLDKTTNDYALIVCYYNDVSHLEVLDMLQEEFVFEGSDAIICLDKFTKDIFKQKAEEAKLKRRAALQKSLF